ncbi:hypothetical protein [Paenibacillus sp. ALJ109b]|uniref:hypothetical protein n=1 Tax=Paenibacillus sp. ALJ109b TaxID=2709068 RepID=UPI0019684FB1|nr:hypothetical protein [Paenibacillus sp. ALJ109b]
MGIRSVHITSNDSRCTIEAEQGKYMENAGHHPGAKRNKYHNQWNNQQEQKK